MNQITLKGRLCHTPELKQTPNGVSVVNTSIAVNRTYTPKGEERQADFFDITAWRGTAELIAKYFQKGQEILLTGEMQSRKYTDKEGKNRIAWQVSVDRIEFCGNKSDNVRGADVEKPEPVSAQDSDFAEIDDTSDLPF